MMNKHNISGGIWLIEPEYAQGYLPLVANYLKGNNRALAKTTAAPDELTERNSIQTINPTTGTYEISEYGDRRRPENAQQGSIAVIEIADVITKYDQDCGPAGMVTKANLIKRCYATDNITAIILKIDSGGGEGYAMFHLCETIAQRNKPVYAFVSDFACSAAYGIASACDTIYANMDLAKVGSIGAYTTLISYLKYFKRQGVDIEEIYAPQSEEGKNMEFREAIKGNPKPMKEMLRIFTDKFLNMVAENRKAKLTANSKLWNTGKTMYANDAIEIGLVDKVCTWNEMIAEIDLNVTNKTNNNFQTMKTQPLNLNAVLNVESLESSTDGVYLNESQIEAIDTELATRQTALTNANTEKAAAIATQQTAEQALAAATTQAATDVAAVNATLTARDAEIVALTAQVVTLKSTAGGGIRRIVTGTDEPAGGNSNAESSFSASITAAREMFRQLPD